MSAEQPPIRVVAITAGTNPISGIEQLVIEYEDGAQQVHEAPWSEGRELAQRDSTTARTAR